MLQIAVAGSYANWIMAVVAVFAADCLIAQLSLSHLWQGPTLGRGVPLSEGLPLRMYETQ